MINLDCQFDCLEKCLVVGTAHFWIFLDVTGIWLSMLYLTLILFCLTFFPSFLPPRCHELNELFPPLHTSLWCFWLKYSWLKTKPLKLSKINILSFKFCPKTEKLTDTAIYMVTDRVSLSVIWDHVWLKPNLLQADRKCPRADKISRFTVQWTDSTCVQNLKMLLSSTGLKLASAVS